MKKKTSEMLELDDGKEMLGLKLTFSVSALAFLSMISPRVTFDVSRKHPCSGELSTFVN